MYTNNFQDVFNNFYLVISYFLNLSRVINTLQLLLLNMFFNVVTSPNYGKKFLVTLKQNYESLTDSIIKDQIGPSIYMVIFKFNPIGSLVWGD